MRTPDVRSGTQNPTIRPHLWLACIPDFFRIDPPRHPSHVLECCYTTLLPWSPSHLSAHMTPAADLHDPFWVLATPTFYFYVFSSRPIILSDGPIYCGFSLLSAVSRRLVSGLGRSAPL